MMAQRRSLIYLCKRNVPLSHSSLCNCNKRTIIASLSWASLPVGRICNRSDDIMRWFSRGSYRCYDPSSLLPSHSNASNNCEVPRKSLSSVSTKHNLQSQSSNKSTEERNPKKIRQASKIKSLHKENKSLFGDLLETKVDKVKRTRKELKENQAKPLHSKKRNGNLQGKEDFLNSREESYVVDNDSPPESLPKQESVRLEHAGMLINKNRKVHDTMDKRSEGRSKGVSAHKGAEIKWALRNAPSRMKLIELSPSSSSDAVVDMHDKGHTFAGDSSSAIEIDRAYVGKQKREPNNPLSEPLSSESLPTVEQLINSFYETDDGQLWPRSESRKILLTDSTDTASESRQVADSFSSQNETEHINAIIEDTAGDHYDQKKTMSPNPKRNDSNQIARRYSTNRSKPQPQRNNSKNYPTPTGPDTSLFALPYYNPERNVTGEFKMYEDESRSMNLSENCDDHNNQKTAESIISFPFPYSTAWKKKGTDFGGGSTTDSAQHSQRQDDHSLSSATSIADGIVEPDNRNDNKLIMRSESLSHEEQRQPLVVTSSKVPSVSKILNATMPEEQAKALKRWEQKMIAQMGEQGFRQYKESILTNGKALHRNIETYLRGPTEEIPVAEANQGHWSSLSGILASVEHVHVLESHVIHPKLQYCGVIDCVAEFRNRLVLIDWKTSQKPKPLVSMTYDTPLQIAAYIGAINYDPKYSLKIDDGLIVVAYEDGSSCQTFLLSQLDVGKYWKLWLKRVQLFRQLAPPV